MYDTSLNLDAEKKSLDVDKLFRERHHEVKIQVNRFAKERQISQDICSMFHTPESLISVNHDNHVSFVNTIIRTVTYKINDTNAETDGHANHLMTVPKKPPRRHPPKHKMIVTADVHKEASSDFTTLLNEECPRGHSTLNEISSKNLMNFQAALKKFMLTKSITSHPTTVNDCEVNDNEEIQTENDIWSATTNPLSGIKINSPLRM